MTKTYNMNLITWVEDGYPVQYCVKHEPDLSGSGERTMVCENMIAMNTEDWQVWSQQHKTPSSLKVILTRAQTVPVWFFEAMTDGF